MKAKRYSIGELAEKSGVSRRTVRFYVQRGLIPAPEGAGRGSYYTDTHLGRILFVRAAQAGRLPLRTIPPDDLEPRPGLPIEFVRRVALLKGVTLEFSPGTSIPAEDVLRELARILASSDGEPDKEVDDP